MNLRTYLKKADRKKLAEIIGINKTYLYQISVNFRRPSPETALRIHRATNGAVSINELLYPNGELDSIQPFQKEQA